MKRIALITLLLMSLAFPTSAQASRARHCGAVPIGGGTWAQVYVSARSSVSCGNARAVIYSFWRGNHRQICYSQSSSCRNGEPTDEANSVSLVAGWRCKARGPLRGCWKGHSRITVREEDREAGEGESVAETNRRLAECSTAGYELWHEIEARYEDEREAIEAGYQTGNCQY